MKVAFLLFTAAMALAAQAPTPIRVEGRVEGPGGKPLAQAVVALNPVHADSGVFEPQVRRTTARGQFHLEGAPGRYGVTVTAPGCLPHFRNLDLVAGQSVPPLAIRLEPGGCRVRGSLAPAPGLGLEGAQVYFAKYSEDDGEVFFPVLQQGRFEVTLAPGPYLVKGRARGQANAQPLEVQAEIRGVALRLVPEPSPAGPQTLAWIRRKAIPLKGVAAGQGFADLQALKALVGNATVVGLGEATHGTREFFQLKHRMLEFLVSELGFRVFAIEANLPEAFAVDDYVLNGKGDPAAALAGLYFWTWNTEEVLDMIRWMRAYNVDPAHKDKLRFYGVDMQFEGVACAQAKAWLETAAPAEAARLSELSKELAALKGQEERGPSPAAWAGPKGRLEALLGRVEALKLPGDEADRQLQNLRVLVQFAAKHAHVKGDYVVRDASMAANLLWIQAREHGAKVVLWAHNGHVSTRPGSMAGADPMGWHLRKALGQAYLPIGFAFREGGFQAMDGGSSRKFLRAFKVKAQAQGTLDAALGATGQPVLALDLRTRPKSGPVKTWLEGPQGTWSIGALFMTGKEQGFVAKERITTAFDALLFVDRTTAAHAVGGRNADHANPPASAKAPVNLGFEDGPEGWFMAKVPGYASAVVDQGAKVGPRCLQVVPEGEPAPKAYWVCRQTLDVTGRRGRKVRLTGWLRTDGTPGVKAMLWARVDGKDGLSFVDTMQDRPVTGTDWVEASVEALMDPDAVNLTIGCMVTGKGTAWFDGLRMEWVPGALTDNEK
jgi:erythromycin esterase